MTFHSILLTVHNKQDMIKKVVSSITKNTKGPYELLIVFDGCSDDSEKIVISDNDVEDEVFETEEEENMAGFQKLLQLMNDGMHPICGDIDLVLKVIETLMSRSRIQEQVMFIENGVFVSIFSVIE